MHERTAIHLPEGDCPLHVFTPDASAGKGSGPWPAVIFFMDGLAIRPNLFAMAQRMADAGYFVVLPDMFWRAGPYEALDPKAVFATGNVRGAIGHLMGATNPDLAMADTGAVLDWLTTRPEVKGRRVGCTGYCMGGGFSLTAAGTFPDRIAAAASFHGGSLATDDPKSPHLLAPRMKARVYVGGAVDDASYLPEQAERLEKALTDAGVQHTCEFYEGALHGWTMPDFPIYNEAQAERHWRELLALFAATLG